MPFQETPPNRISKKIEPTRKLLLRFRQINELVDAICHDPKCEDIRNLPELRNAARAALEAADEQERKLKANPTAIASNLRQYFQWVGKIKRA